MIRPERADGGTAFRAVETAAFARDAEGRIVDALPTSAVYNAALG